MAYARNPGHLPEECEIRGDDGDITGWRSVHVRLFGGYDSRKAGHAPWPAGSHRAPATVWKISRPPHPFQIEEWEIA